MQPRVQFVHLRIPESWPDSVEAFFRIVDEYQLPLPPQAGYVPGTILGTLDPQYAADVALTDRAIVIQVALLSLPMFQSSTAAALVDVHSTPRRPLPCSNVQQLAERLTRSLLSYEDNRADIEAFLERCPQEMYACLRRLEWAERIYDRQYRRRRLAYKAVNPDQTTNAVGTLRTMLELLDIAQYKEGWRFDPTLHCNELIYRLRDIFQDGITWSSTSPPARGACIDHWIALILQRFGVEDGEDVQQIVRRFRQRLYRKNR